jgi:precorrin-2 dehydrogenase/sirohydrochlorin ferrochelatase
MQMIPLVHDLSGKNVVIFGGGRVGARKAAFFLPEAEVTVISNSFSPLLSGLGGQRITLDLSSLDDRELSHLLDGVFLAVAATPDQDLNNRIGKICREQGVLFNNAAGEPGDILIPSVIRGEHHLLAISTRGASPAVARFLREHLEASLPDLDRMITLQERLRTALREKESDPERRRTITRQALHDPSLWEALAKGEELAWRIVQERYLQ